MPWNSRNRTYREFGTFRFNRAQRESYALILDIEIQSVIRESYVNFKGNPPYGFWGVATIFEGSVPRERKVLEWPKMRIINVRNEFAGAYFNDQISELKNDAFQTDVSNALDYVLTSLLDFPRTPVLPHKELSVKFKGLDKSQFKFTCYWLEFPPAAEDFLPFDDLDPTRNGNEYPEPTVNPPDDPYQGNDEPSPPFNGADPRDYGPDNMPPSAVVGFGNGTFEFAAASTNGEFSEFTTTEELGYPGFLREGTRTDIAASIAWEDADGTVTNISGTDFPPLTVRNFTIAQPDGGTYSPLSDSLTVN